MFWWPKDWRMMTIAGEDRGPAWKWKPDEPTAKHVEKSVKYIGTEAKILVRLN